MFTMSSLPCSFTAYEYWRPEECGETDGWVELGGAWALEWEGLGSNPGSAKPAERM